MQTWENVYHTKRELVSFWGSRQNITNLHVFAVFDGRAGCNHNVCWEDRGSQFRPWAHFKLGSATGIVSYNCKW